MKMNEWVKILVTSSVVSGVLAGVVSWLTTTYKIEQELYSRQGEASYEALVKANERNHCTSNDARRRKRVVGLYCGWRPERRGLPWWARNRP